MLTFFAPRPKEKFAIVVNGDNIYSWADGYGYYMEHRNIGLAFPTPEMAKTKLNLMKHIMFCADKYWVPSIGDTAFELSNDIIWTIAFDENCFYAFSIWTIMDISTPQAEIDMRMEFLRTMNFIIQDSLREYKPAELENILNSY